jgi:hypothetical protein
MLRHRNLGVVCAVSLALLSACVTSPPPAPPAPSPAPVAIHGYHLTLYDSNGVETNSYDLGSNDIIRDDPLHQEIWFRVNGQEKHFHGSYRKERR